MFVIQRQYEVTAKELLIYGPELSISFRLIGRPSFTIDSKAPWYLIDDPKAVVL